MAPVTDKEYRAESPGEYDELDPAFYEDEDNSYEGDDLDPMVCTPSTIARLLHMSYAHS